MKKVIIVVAGMIIGYMMGHVAFSAQPEIDHAPQVRVIEACTVMNGTTPTIVRYPAPGDVFSVEEASAKYTPGPNCIFTTTVVGSKP